MANIYCVLCVRCNAKNLLHPCVILYVLLSQFSFRWSVTLNEGPIFLHTKSKQKYPSRHIFKVCVLSWFRHCLSSGPWALVAPHVCTEGPVLYTNNVLCVFAVNEPHLSTLLPPTRIPAEMFPTGLLGTQSCPLTLTPLFPFHASTPGLGIMSDSFAWLLSGLRRIHLVSEEEILPCVP